MQLKFLEEYVIFAEGHLGVHINFLSAYLGVIGVIKYMSPPSLTHWGQDKMATILQMTLSSAWKKMSEFWLKFQRCFI